MKRIYLLIAIVLVFVIHYGMAVIFSGRYEKMTEHYFGDNTDYEYPAQVISLNNGIVVAGRVALNFFDSEGFLKWSRPLNAFGSLCAGKGDRLALCEKNSGEFYILNTDGEIVHQSDKYGKIKGLKAFDNQSFGFSTERGIYIYSGSADKIYFVSSQPGDLIDYSYSDYNKKLAVITLDTQVNNYINLLTVTGEITAGKIIREGLVFDVYLDKDKIVMIKDDGIFEYDYSLEELSEGSVWANHEEYDTVYSYSSDMDVLCAKFEGKYFLWKSGKILFPLEKPAKAVYRIGSDYLLDQEDIHIVNGDGKSRKVLASKEEVPDVVVTGNDSLAIIYANKIEFYRRR